MLVTRDAIALELEPLSLDRKLIARFGSQLFYQVNKTFVQGNVYDAIVIHEKYLQHVLYRETRDL